MRRFTSGKTHLGDLDRARGELQTGFAACHEHLRALFGLPTSQRLALWSRHTADSRRSGIVQDILKAMGESLSRAFKYIHPPSWESAGFRFYCWPGYHSIAGRAGTNRVTLYTPDGVPCGCGYSSPLKHATVHYYAETAVWYDRVLAIHDTDSANRKQPFIPGGTHSWALELAQALLRDNMEGSSAHLSFLEIAITTPGTPQRDVEEMYGGISVPLQEYEWRSWPEQIRSTLASKSLGKQIPWPRPLRDNLLSLDEKQEQCLDRIRLSVYAIWLAATFGPADLDHFKELLRQVRDELAAAAEVLPQVNISALLSRLDLSGIALDDQWQYRTYRCWYTLPLDPTVDTNGDSSSLGSFMLLTTEQVPTPFLYMISSWVHRIYGELRQFELLAAADESDRRKFAHLVQGYIDPVQDSVSRAPDNQAATAALRQLQFAVNTFDIDTPLRKLDPEDERYSSVLDWDACVTDAIHLARQRLSKRYSASKKADGKLTPAEDSIVKAELKGAVRGRWNAPNGLVSEIGFRDTNDVGGPRGCRVVWGDRVEEGLYTYVLAQAFFHAAVYSCISRTEVRGINAPGPYAGVTWNASQAALSVRSRTLELVSDFNETTDYETISKIIERFNSVAPGWIEWTYTCSEAGNAFWFSIDLILCGRMKDA